MTITKQQLLVLLKSWQVNKVDAEAVQEWMVNHYDPPETKVGPSEPEHTQEAMNIVMNEYEVVQLEKITEDSPGLAIEFVECNGETFWSRRNNFLRNGFID